MKYSENYVANTPTLKYNYFINILNRDIQFRISADCEQDALDRAIDYLLDIQPDLLMSFDQEDELRSQGTLKEYLSGGTDGRYLTTKNVEIEITENKKGE